MKRKTARPWRVHLRSTIASFTIAAFLLLTVTVGSDAQAAGKVSRIGYLDQGSAARNTVYLDQLRQGLRELGWVEGQNITIEPRFAEGNTDRLSALAVDLVRLKMDVIACPWDAWRCSWASSSTVS